LEIPETLQGSRKFEFATIILAAILFLTPCKCCGDHLKWNRRGFHSGNVEH